MEQTLTTIISGFFSVTAALGSVWLKHRLEQPNLPVAPQNIRSSAYIASVRPLLVLLAGFVTGAASRYYDHDGRSTLVAVVVLSLVLVFVHRRSRRGFWPYQLDNAAQWASFTAGYSLVGGHVWSFSAALAWWIGCALAGGAIVFTTRPRRVLA